VRRRRESCVETEVQRQSGSLVQFRAVTSQGTPTSPRNEFYCSRMKPFAAFEIARPRGMARLRLASLSAIPSSASADTSSGVSLNSPWLISQKKQSAVKSDGRQRNSNALIAFSPSFLCKKLVMHFE
jgi:hypothetical protein